MKFSKIWLIAAALCTLTACGNSKSASQPGMSTNDRKYEGAGSESAAYEYPEEEKSAEQEIPQPDSNEISNEFDPVQSQQKLVYTGRMNIQTLHYQETKADILKKITQYGGIIENENEYDNGYGWYYKEDYVTTMHMSWIVRIPTEHYNEFMNDLEGSEKVLSKSSSVENITRRYNDNSARIEALELQEKRLLEMMEKAETIEDMITVETRLTEVQMDLNELKTWKNEMDTDIEYSTIYLELDEVRKYTEHNDDFITRFTRSFADGWDSFTEALGDIAIGIGHTWPYLIILAVLIVIGIKKKLHPVQAVKKFFGEAFKKGRKID